MILMVLCVSSCFSDDDSSSVGTAGVRLAMNVSTNHRQGTRMSSAITQQSGVYRGIQEQHLFPFDVQGSIGSGAAPISTYLSGLRKYEDHLYYYDDRDVRIPIGTASFLCYCKAVPENDPFVNGSLISNLDDLNWATATTSNIRFELDPIYPMTEGDNSSVPVDEKATALADYLTAIAHAKPTVAVGDPEIPSWSAYSEVEAQAFPQQKNLLRSLFREFINEGHPIACSSEYAVKWVNRLKTKLNNLELEDDEGEIRDAVLVAIDDFLTAMENGVDEGEVDPRGYPANIGLPEGVAVVQWIKNGTTLQYEFVPVVQTTTAANVNSLNRFTYPAELYYYANSRIVTSRQSQLDKYQESTWAKVLENFTDGQVVDAFSKSIAVVDPLCYAVGCLQLGFNVSSSPLQDAEGHDVALSGTGEDATSYFPLNSLFVSSQYSQGFNFEPLSGGTADEYIIYDKKMELPAIRLGSCTNSTPTDEQYTSTLVLQSKDGAPVRFAMEFTNDSGASFEGINGTIFDGMKFYLVGQIHVPTVQDKDYEKRVFTKNHITKGVINISSLKDAYTYLPDLLDPRLEVGIQLVPDWIQSTTTNVPL